MDGLTLNFHHLRYFWAVANDGNLTRTAKRLHVSQSALSSQIRQLEGQLGQALFTREGRALKLTEAGRVALAYADGIFASGGELVQTLQGGRSQGQALRVGAVATLSRNFQESFLAPLLGQSGVRLQLQSGSLDELLGRLHAHRLDLVLSNRPVQRDAERAWRCRRIAQQPVSLVGRPRARAFRFPQDVRGVPLLLPGTDSETRTAFDTLCEQLGLQVQVLAEVDDMAMMRLLARDAGAVALLPSVVVRDELLGGVLEEYCEVPGILERFYAITVERRFPHPLLRPLLARKEDEILAMDFLKHEG
jgi:LysR family transcriptional activator of nhaA